MNESVALDGAGSLSMETSHLRSITRRWDAGILAGGRLYVINNTALSVLLIGMCLGVLQLLLFMLAVCCKKVNTRHLTVFKVSLIFAGLLQSLSTPLVVMNLIGTHCYLDYCYKLLVVWFASRQCGVLLHLLVALEFIVIWKLPVYWTLPSVLTLYVICMLFFEVTEAAVALGAVAMTLTLAVVIQAFCISRSMDKHSIQVITATFLSFGVTYFPSFVFECMILNNEPVSIWLYDIFLCLTNLRLITDGYLLRETCMETPEEAPQQMEAGQTLESLRQEQL